MASARRRVFAMRFVMLSHIFPPSRWRARISSSQMGRGSPWRMRASMSSRTPPRTRWGPRDESKRNPHSFGREHGVYCEHVLTDTCQGGVNSSSLEVFAALALPPEDHSALMCYDPRKGCLVASAILCQTALFRDRWPGTVRKRLQNVSVSML